MSIEASKQYETIIVNTNDYTTTLKQLVIGGAKASINNRMQFIIALTMILCQNKRNLDSKNLFLSALALCVLL